MAKFIDDQRFFGKDFEKEELEQARFDSCIFQNCNFQGVDLSNFIFNDCEFIECNLSNITTNNTSFGNISFIGCKMFGIWFDVCNSTTLKMRFENCQLNHSSFHGVRLKKTIFCDCNLYEVDMSEADLTEAKMERCDMTRTVFEKTNLEKCDMCTSHSFQINPEMNKMKKAVFSKDGVIGLLAHLDIKIV